MAVTYQKVAVGGVVVSAMRYVDGVFTESIGLPPDDANILVLREWRRQNDSFVRYEADVAAGASVLDPVAPPVVKHDYRELTAEIQTSDALGQSRTLLTAPLELATGYTAEILVFGVADASPWDRYTMRASVDAARLGGNAILDGQSAYPGYPRKSNAGAWTNVAAIAAVSGGNFLINVTGQAGITINWQALVKFYRFNQAGLIG